MLEKIILWMEQNVLYTMIAIGAILLLITIIVAISIGKKRNKKFASDIARAEGEKTAEEEFAKKALEVDDKNSEIVEVKPIEVTPEVVVENEPKVEVVEKVEEKPATTTKKVTVKAKPAKRESTFSPRKKSVTVIDHEYSEAKKEEKVATPTANKTSVKKVVKETDEKKVAEVKVETTKAPKASGAKWEIHRTGNSFYYLLRASNGEVLATSEAYSTEEGAKAGIKTLIKNIETGDIRIDEDKNENFCFKITSRPPFPRLLCVGQSYKYRKSAEGSFEAVKRLTANNLPVVSCVGEEDSNHFEEIIVEVSSIAPSNLPGKWEIVDRENGKFGIVLRASNGVLVLKGEPRASEASCLEYIERIKKYLKVGTVKVQQDKNGQYCYKLFTNQKRIVCVGENYSSAQSAVSSAESLARFAENANIVNLTAKAKEGASK